MVCLEISYPRYIDCSLTVVPWQHQVERIFDPTKQRPMSRLVTILIISTRWREVEGRARYRWTVVESGAQVSPTFAFYKLRIDSHFPMYSPIEPARPPI